MNITAIPNDYQKALGRDFDATPKAVLAAIAVSALTTGGERLDQASEALRREWWILHSAGIVPQKPPFPRPPEPES